MQLTAEHEQLRATVAKFVAENDIERPPMVATHGVVTEQLHRLKQRLAPDAKVVTYWAGIPAFFSNYRLVDGFGYNDAETARQPVREGLTWKDYWPGHVKSDPMYLLAQRPDAFFQFWPTDLERLPTRRPRHFLRQQGYVPVATYWLRADSSYLKPGALEAPEEL